MKRSATFGASFWIDVHRAGLLHVIAERYHLHYPPAVASELVESFPSGRAFWEAVHSGQLTESTPRQETVREFGPGERGAINLALDHPDWVLLLDDQRPFRDAADRGLRVTCSPVLVAALHMEGRLTALDALTGLARLAALGTVSPHLLEASLFQVGGADKPQGAGQ